MDIFDKLEKIRRKPEHIRLRYVWGAVAVCMFFLVFVWIFSLKVNISKINFGSDTVSGHPGENYNDNDNE